MTTIEVKTQAKILKAFLDQQNSSGISLSSCYQAIAKINGFKDWNTMSAFLNTQSRSITKENDLQLSMDPEIMEGALNSLLQAANLYPYHYVPNKNADDEMTGFSLIMSDARNGSDDINKLEINDLISDAFKNVSERKFLLGVKLGQQIENHLSLYHYGLLANNKTGDVSNIRKATPYRHMDPREFNLVNKARFATGPKSLPKIEFINLNLDEHPKLKAVKFFLDHQDPVADIRCFLLIVKEMLKDFYYVGFGGTHIHIKDSNNSSGNMIAVITCEEQA